MSTARFRTLVAILPLIAVLLIVTNNGLPSSAAGPLQNPGFESGALDGAPVGWEVVTPVADVVGVVDTETSSEFQAYADICALTPGCTEYSVAPYRGNLMLRTGTPQRLAQNQNKGNNMARQEFLSSSSTFDFSFRAFSWEHRGQDLVRFNIQDITGLPKRDWPSAPPVGTLVNPIELKNANNVEMDSCSAIPCELNMDVGDQGQFFDSGWREVKVTGLPVGQTLLVSYDVNGTKDASKPTWAYWDNVNTPPVAKFAFAPCAFDEVLGACTTNPSEGDIVQFIDLSYDPDPGDSIVSRTWVIDGQAFTSKSPYFLFPDEANYVVSVSVTDTYGAQTIVLDSQTALDGDIVPDLVVSNAKPLVNALNIEVLDGQEFTLRGRFIDAGHLDEHTATWSIQGNPAPQTQPLATVEEEHEPLLSSGLVTGKMTAYTGLTGGTMTVDDGDPQGAAEDPFTITVVPDADASKTRYEPNDTTINPPQPLPVVTSDNAILSFLQQDGDIDIYEVGAEAGPVKAGSEILVSATGLAADVDIAILSKLPTNASAGWNHMGWNHNGWNHNGWNHNGWNHNGWNHNGWNHNGWNHNGWNHLGEAKIGLQSFSQSGVSWADVGWFHNGQSQNGYLSGGNEVGSLDVNIAELGLGTVGGDDLKVADFSANRGLDDEVAWARSAAENATFYVAVFSSDGEESVSPYTLSVEILEPPDIEVDLGPLCAGSAPVTPAAGYDVLYDYDDPSTPVNDADAVFITQKQRLQRAYGMDAAAWDNFMGVGDAVGLIDLASLDKARADIISVPSTFMDDFDQHPCSVEAANSAAKQVRTLVDAQYPAVKHRVVVGNDDIIPFLRKLDHTVIGNEKDYLLDSFTEAGSPLFAALLQGYMITDDHLGEGVDLEGDPASNPWQGEEAYVPSIAVGRLVETPQEILWHVQAGVASNLTLQPSSGAVFGYDFFTDGTGSIQTKLDDALGEVVDKTAGGWTSEDMRCLFLGVGSDPSCGVRDIVSPNGHSTHWAILAAAGFGDGQNIDFTDSIGSNEVAALGNGTQPLKNTMVFAMGCHLGFNSPDEHSLSGDPETGTTPAMDFPQAFAQHGALAILSTGFGYGDDEGKGGHEKLFDILPGLMFAPGTTVGEALAAAKQQYLRGLVTISVYDLKVSMETALYGLPMYTVEPVGAASALLAVQQAEAASTGTPLPEPFQLTTVDPGAENERVTSPHERASNGSLPPAGRGIYYTLDGEAEGAVGHTLQPSFEVDVDKRHRPSTSSPPDPPPDPVHGVRILEATYADEDNDPVFTRPKDEWDLYHQEEQRCQAGYSPSELAKVNSFHRGPNLTQTLVGVAGQFRCTDGGPPTVTGIERLYSSLVLELRRCPGFNTDGPDLHGIELREIVPGTVDVRIDVGDDSAITRVEVLRVDEGSIVARPATLTQTLPLDTGFRGIFNASVDSVEQSTDMLIQVEDDECNVTLDTFKSAGINFLKVDAGPDQLMPANRTVTFTGKIEGFSLLTSPAWFDWQFGDGKFLDGVLLPADKRSGVDSFSWDPQTDIATFTVHHEYGAGIPTPITATLEVHDSAGGNGSDETHIVCDPTGDAPLPAGDWIGCGSSNKDGRVNIAVTITGQVADNFQYRINLDVGKYNTKKKRYEGLPDGIVDATLKYNGGQVNGAPSLTVCGSDGDCVGQVAGNQLIFKFNWSDFNLSTAFQRDQLRWYGETQAGIPGQPAAGQVDRIPDSGWLSHKIE